MTDPQKTQSKGVWPVRVGYALRFVLPVVLVLPIVIYVATFGPELSHEHVRWAEFGSAMAGIYAPILAVLTLLVLSTQVRLQGQMNKHEFDRFRIEQATADVGFYCTQLGAVLDRNIGPGHTLRMALHERFQPRTVAELKGTELRSVARDLWRVVPQVTGYWMAIYPMLAGLAVVKEPPYEAALGSSVSKLIAVLGYETCATLDNFVYSCTDWVQDDYRFSPLLRKNSGGDAKSNAIH